MRNKIVRMMTYLKLDKYDIPSYGLMLPGELKEFVRFDKKFTFYKQNGTMTYVGSDSSYGPVKKPNITLEGLYPPDEFIARLYSILEVKCLDKAKDAAILHITELQLKSNALDFLNLKKIKNPNF